MIISVAFNSKDHIFVGSALIYRSVDNGANWVQLDKGPPDVYVTALVVNSEDTIFAGTFPFDNSKGRVLRSTNNGDDWTETGLNGYNIISLAIPPR